MVPKTWGTLQLFAKIRKNLGLTRVLLHRVSLIQAFYNEVEERVQSRLNPFFVFWAVNGAMRRRRYRKMRKYQMRRI